MRGAVIRLALAASLAAGAVMVAAPAEAVTTCTGTINGGTIDGNVVVPSGATCVLDGVEVRGKVKVEANGSLDAVGGTRVRDEVVAKAARDLDVDDASLGKGALVVKSQGAGERFELCSLRTGGPITVRRVAAADRVVIDGRDDGTTCADPGPVDIAGRLEIDTNRAPVRVEAAQIVGSVGVYDNKNTGDGIVLAGNEIIGSLECFGNAKIGNAGQMNSAHSKTGQCAAL